MASVIVNNFNEILLSFLIQIVPIVGSTYHNNIQTIIKFNSAVPIENFLFYAIECRDKIINKDDSKGFQDDLQKITDDYVKKLEAILKKKEQDLMKI